MRSMGGRPVLLQRFPNGVGGNSFFQKRIPDVRARVARDHDRQHAERHEIARARHRRSRARGVGDEHGLPRVPRLAGPRGRRRAHRRAAHRPRPAAGRHLRPGARSRARGEDACSTTSSSRAGPRPPAAAASTSTSSSSPAGTPTTCGTPRWPSRASWPAVAPTSSPTRGGRRSGASGCSSTSTRTRRTRRCSARGRCDHASWGRCRRRSSGTRSTPSSPTSSRCSTVPERVAADGDAWADKPSTAAVDRAAARAARAGPGQRAARRAVAAGVPEAGRRADPRRPEPGEEDGLNDAGWSRPPASTVRHRLESLGGRWDGREHWPRCSASA